MPHRDSHQRRYGHGIPSPFPWRSCNVHFVFPQRSRARRRATPRPISMAKRYESGRPESGAAVRGVRAAARGVRAATRPYATAGGNVEMFTRNQTTMSDSCTNRKSPEELSKLNTFAPAFTTPALSTS